MQLTLVDKRVEAKDTISFFFKPADKISWLVGQYYYVTFPQLYFPDSRGTTRQFTIASSPSEGANLRITTRIRDSSGFKKTLAQLPIGAIIEAEGPHGTFTPTDNKSKNKQLLLAGGIGITPFRSILKYAVDNRIKKDYFLIYANSGSEFVFRDELDLWQAQNPNIKVNYFDTTKVGRLNAKLINTQLGLWEVKPQEATFWLSGPSGFVNAMEDALENLEVSLDEIMTDKFIGY